MILPFRTPTFTIELMAPRMPITLDTPSKGDFYMLMTEDGKADTIRRYTDVSMTDTIAAAAADALVAKLLEYRESNMDFLEIPHTIDFADTGERSKLPCLTAAEHMVYEYSGLDFAAQCSLPVTEFWLILSDAVKFRIMGREDSKDYFEQCYKDMHRISDF